MKIDAANAAAGQGSTPALTVAIAALVLASCGGRAPVSDVPALPTEETNMAATELPAIAIIGGAQDVWPFSFGLDADRALVESTFGSPATEESKPAGGSDSTVLIISWDYPGLSFTFFADEASDTEQLLSVRVKTPDVELRGGLTIDMKIEDALAILGEPGFRSDNRVVFFYYATTIELAIRNDRVSEIALSRAMP